MKISQKEQLLSYLHQFDDNGQRRGITPLEAIGLYRIYRLAARIQDLRDDGVKITTNKRTDATGKVYARYFLTGGTK